MKTVCLLCALMLVLAFLPLPSFYYAVLRWFVCLGALIVLTQEMKRDVSLLGICFIVLMLVFNPVFPIYLYKKILWIPVDFGSAILFVVYAYRDHHLKIK